MLKNAIINNINVFYKDKIYIIIVPYDKRAIFNSCLRCEDMKKKKTSIKMIYTMAVLSGLLGVIALYYPKVADAWNRYVQGRNVGKYVESVNDIDYEKELRAAQEYNEALYQHGTNNITEYTNKLSGKEEGSDTLKESAEIVNPDKEYESLLSVLDDGMMGYVEIPAIHVNVPVYHYTSEEVLAKGVGHLYGTSLPVGGENTHSVITGHTGLMDALIFTDLDKVQKGEYFEIHVLNETIYYEVDEIRVVLPDELNYLSIEEGEDLVTLVTCTPYGVNSHRLLVRGHRVYEIPKQKDTVKDKVTEIVRFPYLIFGMAIVVVLYVIALLIYIWKHD